MKEELPILFKGSMVRAILADEKTETRRLRGLDAFNAQPDTWRLVGQKAPGIWRFRLKEYSALTAEAKAPYNAERLWVRETFQSGWEECPWSGMPHKKNDAGTDCVVWREAFEADGRTQPRWRPSIYMPRWASRIDLERFAVYPARLHEMNDADAIAEGCSGSPTQTPLEQFIDLWNTINWSRFQWATNPWVWVVRFRRVK